MPIRDTEIDDVWRRGSDDSQQNRGAYFKAVRYGGRSKWAQVGHKAAVGVADEARSTPAKALGAVVKIVANVVPIPSPLPDLTSTLVEKATDIAVEKLSESEFVKKLLTTVLDKQWLGKESSKTLDDDFQKIKKEGLVVVDRNIQKLNAALKALAAEVDELYKQVNPPLRPGQPGYTTYITATKSSAEITTGAWYEACHYYRKLGKLLSALKESVNKLESQLDESGNVYQVLDQQRINVNRALRNIP